MTGCTVAILPEGSTVGVDIRGGAPGSYNAACFQHTTQRETADAIFLSGGSFFGLDVAPGVRNCLEKKGRGMDTGYGFTWGSSAKLGSNTSSKPPSSKVWSATVTLGSYDGLVVYVGPKGPMSNDGVVYGPTDIISGFQ